MYLLYTIWMVHTICVSSRAPSQAEAKIVVPVVRTVVVPFAYSAVVRVVVPAAAAFNTVSTRRGP